MSVKTFNVSFPKELADQIDKKAKQQFGSRSDFLRTAAIKYLRDEEKIEQFKKLMAEAKEFAKDISYKSEKEVADEITVERRKREPWRQNIAKFKNRT
ncbi:ribbon-helix-helix protein, CopG family [Candidatus Saccharibacteria bacterium]|nr:ribbon-helix-helix protein, CopG family [Candidatus Saccharibacteria bacterium]